MPCSEWSTDVTRLCERLAERLSQQGVHHPTAAAVALAVRGRRGVDQATFATEVGLSLDQVARAEEGEWPLGDLPPPILQAAARDDQLDLVRLRRLAARLDEGG